MSSAPLTAHLQFVSSELQTDGEMLAAPLREQTLQKSSPPCKTPQLSHLMPFFSLSLWLHKNIQPSLPSHLLAIGSHLECGPYKPFLHIFTAWQEIAVSHSNSGPHFISVFLTIVIVVDKDNDPLQHLLHLLQDSF